MSSRLTRTSLVALAVLALSACENNVSVTETSCEVATDCPRDQACVRGRCVPFADAGLPPLVVVDGGDDTPDPTCTAESEAADCGDGAYCTSAGACAPLPACGGGQSCPDGLSCDQESGACVRPGAGCTGAECGCAVAAECDDGAFCNGVEGCDTDRGECLAGTPPCGGTTPVCDEDNDACVECLEWLDCPGLFDECIDFECVCVPDCTGRECGDDGCGGSCGTCPDNALCGDDGQCGCVPDCTGKACGSDGCGGSCAPGCGAGEACDEPSGQCVCAPDCTGKECGDDGCGGSCGTCPEALQTCDAAGQCVYGGEVCDAASDLLEVWGYDTVSGSLDEVYDQIYEWDARPERYLDNFALTRVRQGESVTVGLAGDFDTYLYVYDVAAGSCLLVAENDDVGDNDRSSSLTFTVGAGSYQVLASSWGERVTGSYTVTTRAQLCGMPVADAATYSKCFPRVTSNEDNEPCGHNWCVDFGNSCEFCCITPGCNTTGTMTVQVDTAGVCRPDCN